MHGVSRTVRRFNGNIPMKHQQRAYLNLRILYHITPLTRNTDPTDGDKPLDQAAH
jgi:hypothetical protein